MQPITDFRSRFFVQAGRKAEKTDSRASGKSKCQNVKERMDKPCEKDDCFGRRIQCGRREYKKPAETLPACTRLRDKRPMQPGISVRPAARRQQPATGGIRKAARRTASTCSRKQKASINPKTAGNDVQIKKKGSLTTSTILLTLNLNLYEKNVLQR